MQCSIGINFVEEVEKYSTEWKLLMFNMSNYNKEMQMTIKNRLLIYSRIIYKLCIQEILNCCHSSSISPEEILEYLNLETKEHLFTQFPKITEGYFLFFIFSLGIIFFFRITTKR